MGLAERLGAEKPRLKGCASCRYIAGLSAKDRAEFDKWVTSGGSLEQLRRICQDEGLAVGRTTFQECIREHWHPQ